MRTVTKRSDYLSGDVTPTMEVILRQNRLEFGDDSDRAWPFVFNTYNTLNPGYYVSDDWQRGVWGDACVNGAYKLRLLNAAMWGGTADYWASLTALGGTDTDWDYSNITDASTAPMAKCRIGVYQNGTASGYLRFYVWYVGAGPTLWRETLRYNTGVWDWTDKVASGLDLSIPGVDAVAVHPVSTTAAFVVARKAPFVWIRYAVWNGTDWSGSGSAWTAWDCEEMTESDIFFSDAELLPDGKYVLVLNLARHGAAHSIIYDPLNDTYSQPYLMLGGGVDDTTYRILCTGLTSVNGRVWAVTYRALEGSYETPYAYHVALCSTANGRDWRDGDYVGHHYCAGKLLYVAGEYSCYIAGNAVVFKGLATNALGQDATALKYTITEAENWRLSVQGVGSAHTLESSMLNHGDALSTCGLLVPGNELTFSLGTAGTNSTIMTLSIAATEHPERYASDRYNVSARGPIYRLAGDGAYRPPAGRIYQGPMSYYSSFTDANTGYGALTAATITGLWSLETEPDREGYLLKGTPDDGDSGIAIIPRSISSQWLTALTHFKAGRAIRGVFIVFRYEDRKNYWEAGLYSQLGTVRLAIAAVVNGDRTVKATTDLAEQPTADNWYALYLAMRPGQVTVYYKNSDTWDLSSAESCTYATTAETDGVPMPFHAGLEVLDYTDATDGADDYGFVTKAFTRQVQDSSKDFDATVLGKYLHVRNQWATVVDYTVVQEEDTGDNIALTVDTPWGELPHVGDTWGLYSAEGDPFVLFSDISIDDGLHTWTVDSITTNVLELSGVGRTSVFTGTLGTLSASSPQMSDVELDISPNSGTTNIEFLFHASTTDAATLTGWQVKVDTTHLYLTHVLDGVSTLTRKYPVLVAPVFGISPVAFRVTVSNGNVHIYAGGHYIGGFLAVPSSGRGYVAKIGSGTYTYTEFPDTQEAYAWGSDEDPNSLLGRLLKGRRAKMVECYDGTVALSRYDTRPDLGAWSTPIVEQGELITPAPSIIGLLGAEHRAFYLEPEVARTGLRYRQADNPAVLIESHVVREAREVAKIAQEEAAGYSVTLYAPDPATELEDIVEIDGTHYIVSGYEMAISGGTQSIKASMGARLRTYVPAPTPGAWGTDKWGQFTYT